MRYAIISNPVSGKMSVDRKRLILSTAAEILSANIHGLDTTSALDLAQCAQEICTRCDVLVVAGGDGTLSDVINAIDTTRTPVAYLPLGTGNAMRHALGYKGNLIDIAERIKAGKIYEFDLIDCNTSRRAFMASVGLEGTVVRLRDQYVSSGNSGFKAYFKAVLKSYFKEYQGVPGSVVVDDSVLGVKKLLSLMVVKHPFYGYGMNVVPKARFDDRQLHVCCLTPGFFKMLVGGITAFTIGNRTGQYCTGQKLTATFKRPLKMQINGNAGWEADSFTFTILPKALKIKC